MEGYRRWMKLVLHERGVDTQGLNAEKLRQLLRGSIRYAVNYFLCYGLVYLTQCGHSEGEWPAW